MLWFTFYAFFYFELPLTFSLIFFSAASKGEIWNIPAAFSSEQLQALNETLRAEVDDLKAKEKEEAEHLLNMDDDLNLEENVENPEQNPKTYEEQEMELSDDEGRATSKETNKAKEPTVTTTKPQAAASDSSSGEDSDSDEEEELVFEDEPVVDFTKTVVSNADSTGVVTDDTTGVVADTTTTTVKPNTDTVEDSESEDEDEGIVSRKSRKRKVSADDEDE